MVKINKQNVKIFYSIYFCFLPLNQKHVKGVIIITNKIKKEKSNRLT